MRAKRTTRESARRERPASAKSARPKPPARARVTSHKFYREKDIGGHEPMLEAKWPIVPPEETASQLVETWEKNRGHRAPFGGPDREQLTSMISAAIRGAVDTATGKSEAYRRVRNKVLSETKVRRK